jgi:hypothetical protein
MIELLSAEEFQFIQASYVSYQVLCEVIFKLAHGTMLPHCTHADWLRRLLSQYFHRPDAVPCDDPSDFHHHTNEGACAGIGIVEVSVRHPCF